MKIHFAGMNTLADPASIDALNGKSKQYGQCVDILNCDLDDEHNAIVRDGFNLVVAGNISSGWTAKDGTSYCVVDGHVCTFNGMTVTPLSLAFTVLPACRFEQVNDVVVFSDGTVIGIIEGGVVHLLPVEVQDVVFGGQSVTLSGGEAQW